MTYWSREVGPYVWHEYDAARTVGELRAIKSAGHHTVRTHLLWDAFMPTPARVEPARLRNLEHFLNVATELSLQVMPVLFVQTLGGCLMLPSYAIDVGARRNDMRVVTDAVTQPGGSRYVYTDQMMLEVCVRWIDEMLSAFAGHPAIVTWDLGHDPAGGVRPQRIDHLRSWLALISERIHEREQRCMLSLSADDLVIARAVRPAVVASLVDAIGLDLSGAALAQVGGERDPAAAIFLAQLCESLSNSAPLVAHLQRRRNEAGTNTDDTEEEDDDDAHAAVRRRRGRRADRLRLCGADGGHVEQPRAAGRAGATIRPPAAHAGRRRRGCLRRRDSIRQCLDRRRRVTSESVPRRVRGPSTSTPTTTTRIFRRACTSCARPGNAAQASTLLCCDEHRNGGKSSSFGASIAVFCGFPLLTGDAPIVVVNAVGVRVGESPGGHAVTAGRIKKIIPDRGFGFVRADDGNEVFFHRTELTTVDFDALQEGEQVTFDIVNSPKGPRARNLQKV